MLRDRYDPINLFALVPQLSSQFEPQLAQLDRLLDDDEIVARIRADLARRYPLTPVRGRRSTPVEVIPRMLVVMRLYGWSYAQVEFFVKDSSVLRPSCRVSREEVPDDTVLIRWANTIGPRTVRTLNDRVVQLARGLKVTRGRKLRVDTTAVETNIHHPTDSALSGDGVRVLSRLLKRAQAVLGKTAHALEPAAFRSRVRTVRGLAQQLHRIARRKGTEARAALKAAYGRLIDAAQRTGAQARRVLDAWARRTKPAAQRLAQRIGGRSRMDRLALSIALIASLAIAGRADDTPKAESPAAQKLEEDPSKESIGAYMMENIRTLLPLLTSNPDAAEKKVAEMKAVLDSVQPKDEDAKKQLDQARMVMGFYNQRIELARQNLSDLEAKLREDPNNPAALSQYQRKLRQELQSIHDPRQAGARLESAKQLLTKLKDSARDEAAKARFDQAMRTLSSFERRLTADRNRADLIGKKAAPLAVETWLTGGAPLSDSDLKGKVVLLDFWAAWCGPCVATFPHLREWREQYADTGLVMIGLTSYYNLRWNDQANRAERSPEEVSHERERAMLKKFVEHHKLGHRIAIQKGDEMSNAYGVTVIPEVVVIDREGTVRLIKVGSGPDNAREIGDMLEKLLATPAGAEK